MEKTTRKILRIDAFFGITGIAFILYALFKKELFFNTILVILVFIGIAILITGAIFITDNEKKSKSVMWIGGYVFFMSNILLSLQPHGSFNRMFFVGVAITVTSLLILIVILILKKAYEKEIKILRNSNS